MRQPNRAAAPQRRDLQRSQRDPNPSDPAADHEPTQARALLRRPTGRWAKNWSTYYGAHSPLDGYGRAVLAGVTLLAQPWASRVDSQRDSSLCLQDQPLELARRESSMYPGVSHSFCAQFAFWQARKCGAGDGSSEREAEAFAYSAAAIRWPDSAPCTLTEIARFCDLPRARVERALADLVDLGEAYVSVDGAWVLVNYWRSQETPSARSKRAARAGRRRVDSQQSEHAESHSDSPVDRHEAGDGDSQRDIPCDLQNRTEVNSRDLRRRPDQSGSNSRAAESRSPASVPRLATNSRATLLEPEPVDLERDARLHERGDRLQVPELPGAIDERREGIEPQTGAQEPQTAMPSSERSLERIGYDWLHSILWPTATLPAPNYEGKWRAAYRYIGERPASERDRVGETLRAELLQGRMRARMCQPQHIQDHWLEYLTGDPPRGRNSAAQGEAPTPPTAATRAQFLAEADRLPAWMNEAAS